MDVKGQSEADLQVANHDRYSTDQSWQAFNWLNTTELQSANHNACSIGQATMTDFQLANHYRSLFVQSQHDPLADRDRSFIGQSLQHINWPSHQTFDWSVRTDLNLANHRSSIGQPQQIFNWPMTTTYPESPFEDVVCCYAIKQMLKMEYLIYLCLMYRRPTGKWAAS